ncbi:hypothetical protein [Marinobacter sp. SS13-12]|uniref:hypothetical protein n=1 Tax=Marinobacter sp. SS13-12 TaxID=3050451 RepID=UPI0025541A37|nr:hypothetical protein [Marinobacter sp. SS13-12]MDK8465905.1 hypothetical protein [Marinobacter sp. SS13-12]
MSFIPRLEDYKNIDEVTVKSGSYSKTYYGLDAQYAALGDAQRTTGKLLVIVIGFCLYLIYEYILKPIQSGLGYLAQFNVETLSDGASFPTIPAFINLVFISALAYFFIWALSFFNKFPNYASRSILALSISFIIALKDYSFSLSILGPLASGYENPGQIFVLMGWFGILSWTVFIIVRFFRFRSSTTRNQSNKEQSDDLTSPADKARKRIAISAFLNRRITLFFIYFLLLIAIFEPNFWPHIPFESMFWSGTAYNPDYNSTKDLYYANLDATPSIILRTVASYLFLLFLVITLQIRSARPMHWTAGYTGYIPPKYIYGVALIGGFCAAVFAFTPYNYPGEQSQIFQAVPPILFIGFSLFRTGRQYYRFMKLARAHHGH